MRKRRKLAEFVEHVLGFLVKLICLLAAVTFHLLHLPFRRTPPSCISNMTTVIN